MNNENRHWHNVAGITESNRDPNSGFLSRLSYFAETLVEQVEKRRLWLLASFSILYLAVTYLIALRKPLWNDELYTLYIARLPSISAVWAALSTGAEQIPPFFYVLTRVSLAFFGASELSLRLPEIMGFWMMSLCLFRFVSKRAPALYGFLAMLFPLVTGAYYYASEARPYGLVLGFSALALLCWQAATEKDRRLRPLASLAISLAAAVSCHYYAVFVFAPLAFAEAVRSLSRRRLDWAVWAAFSLGVAPLLAFLPLIQRAMSYSSTFWSKSRWTSIPESYYFLLAPAVLPLMALLVLSAIYPLTGRAPNNSHHPRRQYPLRFPLHEMAAAFGFMAIPVFAVTLSMLVTGAYADRYGLPAVIGCSLIVATAAHGLLHDRPAIAAILTFSLCGFFLSLGAKSVTNIAVAREAHIHTIDFLRSNSAGGMSDLPIAATDQHVFTNLAHYAPRDVASRLVYLADPDKALRYLGYNSAEMGMLDLLKPYFGLPIEEYDSYVASQRRFFVYGSAGYFMNWLLSDLATKRWRVELKGRNKDSLLFLVDHEEQ
jgi:hypothetical protein